MSIEIRWQCQCGASGWMIPADESLAGMVREARLAHRGCKDPDIERLETEAEYNERLQRKAA